MDASSTDEDLLAQYRAAAADAREPIVEELFSRHYLRVARWCYRFTGDRESAADLAQDVFLRAHRYLETFKGASKFTTWLYSIARHESITRRQQRARTPADTGEDALPQVPDLDASPEELALRGSRAQRLHAFLAETLDPTERSVFTLHYGDDMPLESISRLLRLDNPSGAKAFIVSARRKLARAVQRQRARGELL